MQFNSIIFPSPQPPSYTKDQIEDLNIFFIPKQIKQIFSSPKQLNIPVLYIPYRKNKFEKSDINLLYFHGNAEDIGISYHFLLQLSRDLKV